MKNKNFAITKYHEIVASKYRFFWVEKIIKFFALPKEKKTPIFFLIFFYDYPIIIKKSFLDAIFIYLNDVYKALQYYIQLNIIKKKIFDYYISTNKCNKILSLIYL